MYPSYYTLTKLVQYSDQHYKNFSMVGIEFLSLKVQIRKIGFIYSFQ